MLAKHSGAGPAPRPRRRRQRLRAPPTRLHGRSTQSRHSTRTPPRCEMRRERTSWSGTPAPKRPTVPARSRPSLDCSPLWCSLPNRSSIASCSMIWNGQGPPTGRNPKMENTVGKATGSVRPKTRSWGRFYNRRLRAVVGRGNLPKFERIDVQLLTLAPPEPTERLGDGPVWRINGISGHGVTIC